MKHEMLASVLRHYRKQQKISVRDVVLQLQENDITVSPKTIYAWENGTTQPDIKTMLILCSIYRIPNLQQALGYDTAALREESSEVLTREEATLLERYRRHPEMHDAVNKLLE